MVMARPQSSRRRWTLALIAGVVCPFVFTYGPLVVAWSKPEWMGVPVRRVFSHAGRDFDTAISSGRFAWLGYERVAATPYRSVYAMATVSTARWDVALAEQVTGADVELLGPLGESTMGRTGLEFHRHRAGFPLTAVESSVCLTFGDTPGYERLVGGARLESNAFPYLWLVPWGVNPVGLAGNLAIWTLLWGAAPAVSAWRYRKRLNAGQCVACGYDRRGAPPGPCPECGTPSPASGGPSGGGASALG